MLQKKISLGITGGIGSGKSYVCRYLEEAGVPVFYTDDEAKAEMRENPSIHDALRRLIGPEAVGAGGSPVKSVLAAYICQGREYAARVDAIVHPEVRVRLLHWLDRQTAPVVGVECALLLESGFREVVDKAVLVSAPREVRIRRVMERDGASRQKALEWMSLQMPEEEKRRLCDFEIVNDGVMSIPSQVEHLLTSLAI